MDRVLIEVAQKIDRGWTGVELRIEENGQKKGREWT